MYMPGWMHEPLFAAAAPPCPAPGCDSVLANVQVSWRHDDAGVWLVYRAFILCLDGHRHDITP